MRFWIMALFLGFPALAEDEAEGLAEVPKVGEVISELVGTLPPPSPPAVDDGLQMAITAATKEAADSVRYGMHCLHAGWDFEAYRHFCTALNADSQCLMAHWGVGISLVHGSEGTLKEQDAAMTRMLALVDKGIGTELERRYVFGLVKLVTEGPQAAAAAFAAAAEAFPGDPQILLFKSLLGRGGYDSAGEPTPDELTAERDLRAQIEAHPEASYLRYALLGMRAEAASLSDDLPMARKLCEEATNFAPYFHLLGHYEWRCGHHARAALAFGRACDLYGEWMKATGLKQIHCGPWTKSEVYRAVAFASKGEYETALAIADGLASFEVPLELAQNDGARMLMWEGKTLPVRILLRRGAPGDMKRASTVLPPLKEVEEFGKKSLSLWSYQVHSAMVTGRASLQAGELDSARKISEDITRVGTNFVQTREVAAEIGERSHWHRAFKAFEVMASELQGLVAMAGPKEGRGSAFNWFRSAADRQIRSSMMMPPSVLLPMESRLAAYYLDCDEPTKAIEALLAGLNDYPNDWELLNQLKLVFESEGMTGDAAEVAKRLNALQYE